MDTNIIKLNQKKLKLKKAKIFTKNFTLIYHLIIFKIKTGRTYKNLYKYKLYFVLLLHFFFLKYF